MQHINLTTVIIVGLAAIALIVFVILRNKKDRKKYLPPDSTDPVADQKTEQRNRENNL
jgi:FtsZ-interacting cell division protein ZipA